MNGRIVKASAGVMLVGIIALWGSSIYNSLSDKKHDKEKESQKQNTTATAQTINTVVNSVPLDTTSKQNNYDYSTQGQMSTSAKADSVVKTLAANAPLLYGGIEVMPLRKFQNAKLVGVDQLTQDFYFGTGTESFYAKGLLFELNNDTLLNVIGRNSAFYIGQRYDISYHPFKNGVKVDGKSIIQMMVKGAEKAEATITTDYNVDFDGVLVDYNLIRRHR